MLTWPTLLTGFPFGFFGLVFCGLLAVKIGLLVRQDRIGRVHVRVRRPNGIQW